LPKVQQPTELSTEDHYIVQTSKPRNNYGKHNCQYRKQASVVTINKTHKLQDIAEWSLLAKGGSTLTLSQHGKSKHDEHVYSPQKADT